MTFCEPHSSAILDAGQGNMGLEGGLTLLQRYFII